MRLRSILLVAACLWAAPAVAAGPVMGESLAASCPKLEIEDGCAIVAEASKLLGPSYVNPHETAGVRAFRARGYDVTYVEAKAGWFRNPNDIFLVSRPGSNRLFIVITGTEGFGDAIQDLKATAYTGVYRDGQFYMPPGHGGFHRGMLNVINSGVLRIDEYDDSPLDCARLDRRASALSRHLCRYGMPTGPGQVETIVTGHSLGAGIGLVEATAFAGLEIKRPDDKGPVEIAPQLYWPLALHAVIAFAPPYAIYGRTDFEAGLRLPEGAEDHWTILGRYGLDRKTILFINDRDLVPGLSIGYGRHFGYRFRIGRDDRVTFDGTATAHDLDMLQAHSNVGYCTAVLNELRETLLCE